MILHVKPVISTNSNQSIEDENKYKMTCNTDWKVGYHLVSNNRISYSYTVIHVKHLFYFIGQMVL